MMANKGEWSEPYVAIRILADGRLYLANNEGRRNLKEWMNILSVHRIEASKNRSRNVDRDVRYFIHLDTSNIEIQIDDVPVKNIDIAKFQNIAEALKNEIKSGSSSSFSVSPYIQKFLVDAEIRKLKAKSINKSDIFASLIDPRTSMVREDVGFSIKSEFGKEPTIFNTAPASGAKYKVTNMSDSLMNEINSIVDGKGKSAVTDRCKRLIDSGCELEFVGYPIAKKAGEKTFYENLDNINPRLIYVIERIMWNHFFLGEKARDVPDVVDIIIRQNPCNIMHPEVKYPTMIKAFLYAGYCGMTASKIWNGDSQINGGYINVNRDGEVMAYYAMESDSFKNYLYEKCFVDYPSTSSGHGDYGKVYKEDGEFYFKLNFQIKIHKEA